MTDDEIKKALERCPQHTECCYCNSLEECGNKRILTTSVFDLINRQKAEIERLNIRNKTLIDITKNYDWKFARAKSEAIKEFAERLKEKLQWDTEFENMLVFETDIDNLVKEMTEVNENDRA